MSHQPASPVPAIPYRGDQTAARGQSLSSGSKLLNQMSEVLR